MKISNIYFIQVFFNCFYDFSVLKSNTFYAVSKINKYHTVGRIVYNNTSILNTVAQTVTVGLRIISMKNIRLQFSDKKIVFVRNHFLMSYIPFISLHGL